jgi:RNA polymerase sigma factor (sigma-70 family)
MQPRTERVEGDRRIHPVGELRGDETALYQRYHRALVRAVSHAVRTTPELVEDACQTAWTILLRRQPDRSSLFWWLYVVALREAYRLSAIERRDAHLEDLHTRVAWDGRVADDATLDNHVEAREALQALASLPEGQRRDLTLLVVGFSYREIAAMTGRRSYTNVHKHLAKARARIRLSTLRQTGAKTTRERSSIE